MSKFVFLISLMFVLVGCNGRVNSEQELKSYQLQHDYDVACSAGKCPCASPLGPIVDGGTAVAYDTARVACGKTCSSRAVTLTCSNGKFDRDITNLSFSCGVESCKACTAGNNEVPHGFTVVMYNAKNVVCGASCDDSKRALVCNDGTLQGTLAAPSADGNDGTFKFASCAPSSCNCTLPGNGTLTLGGTLKFFKSSVGTCDAPCEAPANQTTRACVNTGTPSAPNLSLNGDATFQSLSCNGPTQASCDCVLPDAAKTILHHGQSQALFTFNTQTNCTTCAAQQVIAYCGTGVLYDKPLTDPAKKVLTPSILTSHTSLTCDPLITKDCAVNSLCIANNGSQKLYGKATLVCGDDQSALTSIFSCTNKILLKDGGAYNSGSDPYAATWQVAQPTNTCVGCSTPWKASIGDNVKVTAYKSSGSSSNSCGNGCKAIEFTCKVTNGIGKLSSGDSAIDADIITNPANYTKECKNTCSQEGGGAPPRACLLPWQNSFVTPDTLIPMYNQKIAVCGDSCQNHFKVGRCQLATGTFDAGLSYIYQSCTELACGGLKITKVTPTFVPPSGGAISLTGTGFTASTSVKIGGATCSGVSIANGGTTLNCTAPASSGLFKDIVVKDAGQTAMLPRSFSFYSGTCTAGPGSKVFSASFTTTQSFTVPAGCTSVTAKVWGAGGGGHYNFTIGNTQFGGAGGFASGVIPVSPAQVLALAVGGGGGYVNGWGAGGGGYSGVFNASPLNAANALVIAGGGGGAGDPSGCNVGSTGGEGGGIAGGTHGDCSGKGGTQSAGGVGGPGANAGAAFQGAVGGANSVQGGYFGGGGASSSQSGGGGGGGGYYGGGAGAEASSLGGAGGGGSGFIAGTVTNSTNLNGNAQYPPNMNDPNYVSGVGLGGGLSAGGSGLIVISW